jgi:type I restriction enzyme R subunit
MPAFTLNLKWSSVSQAYNQIEKLKRGSLTGLFSLVQVFVAMEPDECIFCKSWMDGKFNKDYYFIGQINGMIQ